MTGMVIVERRCGGRGASRHGHAAASASTPADAASDVLEDVVGELRLRLGPGELGRQGAALERNEHRARRAGRAGVPLSGVARTK